MDKLHQYANNTLATGWLQLSAAGDQSHWSYRIPGTEYQYVCSNGFELPNKTNPIQTLKCQGSGLVDTTYITSCIRKYMSYK